MAAGTKIRGITVELGADASGIETALKSVNKTIKTTQSELKDVEKLLKLDPTNTELLRQKQQLLGKEISETKSKLESLKSAQASLDSSGVDKSSEQYMALQREIIATENELKNLETAAAKANATLSKIQAASDKVAEGANKVANATKGITVAVTAVATASIKTSADFETAMSQLAATMGTTRDQIDDLADFAKEMGAATSFSAVEAAEGLNTLALAGLTAKEQMAALPTVLDLAAAGAMDMATAASYVVGAVKGFSDSMENSAYYADLIAKGATMAATDVDELGLALSETAASAAAYGQSADSVTLSLLRLAEQNVTGSEAVTALTRAMADLYTPSDQAKAALEELGVSAYDSAGNARDFNVVVDDLNAALSGMSAEQQNVYKNTIFSLSGIQAFNKMTVATTEKVNAFREGLAAASGSASNQAATQLDNLNGKLILLKSALEGAAISIGERLTPYVEKLIDWVQQAVDWFNSLSDEQLDLVITIAAVIAAIAPVAMIIAGIASAVSGVISVINALNVALTFLLANPVVLVIAAITAAIIALTILIIANWDEIRAVLSQIGPWISSNIIEPVKEFFKGLVESIKSFFASLPAWFQSSVVTPIVSAFNRCVQTVKNVFATAVSSVEQAWASVAAWFESIVATPISSLFRQAGEDIRSAFTSAMTAVSNVVSSIFNSLAASARSVVNSVISMINGIINAVNNALSALSRLVGAQSSVSIRTIPMMAKGGILSSGSAIVGENGPELLTMLGSKAQVTPLTATLSDKAFASLQKSSAGNTETITKVNIEFNGSLAQLARVLQPAITAESSRRGTSLING